MGTDKAKNKRGRPKGTRKKFHITYEIVYSDPAKNNSSTPHKTSEERWEEIIEICSAIIAESSQNTKILSIDI